MIRLARRGLSCLVLALVLAAPGAAARAQGANVDDETRATARIVAQEGLDFYDKGRYKEALDRLERANALVSAPTLGLMIARCLQKLGRLVEASERYLDVSRTKLDAKASDLFKKAVTDAGTEREALLPRIPSVTVVVEGQGPSDAAVTIDGKPIPPAVLGIKRLINPGDHTIEATWGEIRDTQQINLKEGESRQVTLMPKRPEEGAGGGDTSKPIGSRTGPPLQKILGIVAIGVGGAGLATGAVTGGLAAGKLSDLEAAGCSSGHCLKTQRADVDSYNTLRLVSMIGLYAGAGIAAGGVVLVLTAPKSAPTPGKSASSAGPAAATIQPYIGVGSAGVVGTF